MTNVTINLDLDKKCAECGKPGAADSGICLRCTTKALGGSPMKSSVGRAVQARIRQTMPRQR